VILDEDGYPKVIDFGAAKVVDGRTYTILGTPHYMAPEIVMGKGYSFTADLWSLGIMIYEFVC
jgi:cGMP-dependent protein kinase